MVGRFEFATAGRIVFGAGSVREAAGIVKALGGRALVVTGSRGAGVPGLEGEVFRVGAEPTVALVREGVRTAREAGCDVVTAVGGGSVLDAGKAIAALAANPGDALDYLEVIGAGKPLTETPLPFIAIPTTAGTGAEVTRNAVLGSPEHGVKASLRSPLMLPRVAIIDPELAVSLPPAETAATGLDALTQLIEPWVSPRANALTDALCLEGIRRVAAALPRAYRDRTDLAARTDMALGALYGGLALANAGLGAVHGFAAAVGGQFPAPHGAVCAALLPWVIRANTRALRRREAGSEALRRYGVLTDVLGEDPAEFTLRLVRELAIPGLGAYGVREEHVGGICQRAAQASSMKANPVVLTPEELAETLRAAL